VDGEGTGNAAVQIGLIVGVTTGLSDIADLDTLEGTMIITGF